MNADTITKFFQARDDKPPRRKGADKATVRTRIERTLGPYRVSMASSCGHRLPIRVPSEEGMTDHLARGLAPALNRARKMAGGDGSVVVGGFVSLRLYDKRLPDDEQLVGERTFQADGLHEAYDEYDRLIRLIRTESAPSEHAPLPCSPLSVAIERRTVLDELVARVAGLKSMAGGTA